MSHVRSSSILSLFFIIVMAFRVSVLCNLRLHQLCVCVCAREHYEEKEEAEDTLMHLLLFRRV